MVKRLAMIAISSLVGVMAVFFWVRVTEARKWVTDDAEYWQIDQTCRDGARITLINEQTIASAPQPGQTIDVVVQARLFTRPFADSLLDPVSGWFTSTESKEDLDFYPLLSAGQRFTETVYQSVPLYADLDDDGSDDLNEDYFLLYTTGVIRWPQRLKPGTAVLFPANFGTILTQVEDCALDPLRVGEEVLLDPVYFGPDYSAVVSLDPAKPDPITIVPPDELLTKIETAPSSGSLLLDGTPLAAGDFISRTVLNSKEVRYQQPPPALTADGISFTVRATYVGSLTDTMGVNPSGPTISRFGRYQVAASGDQIFVEDSSANCTIRVSENGAGEGGNGVSAVPTISADGRFIAFQSEATNLVEADSNGVSDIFVYDRDADGDYSFYSDESVCLPGEGQLFRVSIAANGEQANGASTSPQISGNGAFVQFDSAATNLVPGVTATTFVHYVGFSARIRLASPTSVFLPLITK